ncbi:MAG: hypothetical protein R6X35_08310 [Candidatus Krumholzibacteriia bacterium]
MNDFVTARERWLSAICYVPFLVFVAMSAGGRTPFVARHCRQGFALLLAEAVGLAFIWIIDGTLGRVPLIGFLIVILLRLVFFLSVLVISVLGFVKAMFGEEWRIPYLDELADRVPVE